MAWRSLWLSTIPSPNAFTFYLLFRRCSADSVPLRAFCAFFPPEVVATAAGSAGTDERSKSFFRGALARTVCVPSAIRHRLVQTSPSSVFLSPGACR